MGYFLASALLLGLFTVLNAKTDAILFYGHKNPLLFGPLDLWHALKTLWILALLASGWTARMAWEKQKNALRFFVQGMAVLLLRWRLFEGLLAVFRRRKATRMQN